MRLVGEKIKLCRRGWSVFENSFVKFAAPFVTIPILFMLKNMQIDNGLPTKAEVCCRFAFRQAN